MPTSSKRRPGAARWADLRWEVTCDICPVMLARCLDEETALSVADSHLDLQPTHVTTTTHLRKSDV